MVCTKLISFLKRYRILQRLYSENICTPNWSTDFNSCYIISVITYLRPLKCNIMIILQTWRFNCTGQCVCSYVGAATESKWHVRRTRKWRHEQQEEKR